MPDEPDKRRGSASMPQEGCGGQFKETHKKFEVVVPLATCLYRVRRFSESLFYLLKAKETVPIGHPRLVFELRLPPSSMLALLLKLIDYRCLATKYCENRNPSIKYR